MRTVVCVRVFGRLGWWGWHADDMVTVIKIGHCMTHVVPCDCAPSDFSPQPGVGPRAAPSRADRSCTETGRIRHHESLCPNLSPAGYYVYDGGEEQEAIE